MKSPNERDLLLGLTLKNEAVDHPDHYGGEDNPYEAIKVIEAWDLGFHLGNAVKYISRAGKKDPAKEGEDIDKAIWYLQQYLIFQLAKLKKEKSLAEPVPVAKSRPSDFKTVKFKLLKTRQRPYPDAYPEYLDYTLQADPDWTISKLCEIAASQFNLDTHKVYGISLSAASGFLKQDEKVFWALNMWPQPAYYYYLRMRDE